MTSEKSPSNHTNSEIYERLDKEYDLKIGDEKVENFIEALKEARVDDTEPPEAIEVLELALKEAKEERLEIINLMKLNPHKTYTDSKKLIFYKDELELVVSEIDKVLGTGDLKKIDGDNVENLNHDHENSDFKVFKFKTDNKTIETYPSFLEKSKDFSAESFNRFLNQLKEVKNERLSLLTKMECDENLNFVDSDNNPITKKYLTDSIDNINSILSKYQTEEVDTENIDQKDSNEEIDNIDNTTEIENKGSGENLNENEDTGENVDNLTNENEDVNKDEDGNEEYDYKPINVNNPKDKFYILYADDRLMAQNQDLYTRTAEAIKEYNEQVALHSPKEVIIKLLEKIDTLKSEFNDYKEEREPSKPKPSVKIFTMNENDDYSELGNDVGFNSWLENIDKSLRSNVEDFSGEIKDVKDWYTEYQESIPYIEKLNNVFEDIKNTTEDKVEVLAAQNKINRLLYKLHEKKDVAKSEIDKIFSAYIKSKKEKNKIEFGKKIQQIKEKTSGSTKITTEQVREILELRGEENTTENLNELTNFLEDFQENYDFYSSGTKEDGDNNIRYAYEKYKTVGKKNVTPKKVKFLGKLLSRVVASLPRNVDDQDRFNQFIGMTRAIRSFDLVDRKNGNKEKTELNKKKMSDLIEFCKNDDNKDLLKKYIADKNNVDISTIESNPENKKLFETAISLYNTFTQGKYRTSEAKEEVEKILNENVISDTSTTPRSTSETLYSTAPLERVLFEKGAKIEIKQKELGVLSSELNKLLKKKDFTRKEVEKLDEKFTKIKTELESLGDSNNLKLKTVYLKIIEAKEKTIDRSDLKQIFESIPVFDKTIESKSKDGKIAYLTELIKNLRGHEGKGSTIIQNGQLNVIIEKYERELKSIK